MSIKQNCGKLLKLALMTVAAMVFSFGAMWAQSVKVTGRVTDKAGEPLVGVYVLVQGTKTGATTDVDGKYAINAPSKGTLVFSSMGFNNVTEAVNGRAVINVVMQDNAVQLGDVVVTAMGIKKERKALGYSVSEVSSKELLKNKQTNVINSLAGKVAGVNVTQSGGAAGAGSSIIIRGGNSASESRDNQPLFVVDGIIYNNGTVNGGNSLTDGVTNASTTFSNRVMDINPEDIESLSVLKGAAAAALYGSRAADGVVIITTKKGATDGKISINVSSKYTYASINSSPDIQSTYGRGYYDQNGTFTQDFVTSSWGQENTGTVYNNVKDFFRGASTYDNSVSIAGGHKNGNFYVSASRFNQTGVVPGTNYKKNTFRVNGEQKYGIITVGASGAYTVSNTKKTLTSSGLYSGGGNGTMTALYGWSRSENMSHWLNDDGTKYRMFGDKQDLSADVENPYWIINRDKLTDKNERLTANLNVNANITKWLNVSYRLGLDEYTNDSFTYIAPGSAVKEQYQQGRLSKSKLNYNYVSSNLMVNAHKTFGDFDFNLLAGTSAESTKVVDQTHWGYNFITSGTISFANILDANKFFTDATTRKRLVGVYGEFRASYKNIAYLTVTGRNDWSSTLPTDNRSYFYPSVSGSFVFTELLPKNDILSFGKIRASWAEVGKDADAYKTITYMWPAQVVNGVLTGIGNQWTGGSPYMIPEKQDSWEIGTEMRFFGGRLGLDFTYYNSITKNQIAAPRLPQSTGYIFKTINSGSVKNKGIELMVTGTPIENKNFSWDISANASFNRGTLGSFLKGIDIFYVTETQIGGVKAASIPNGGHFMALTGDYWLRETKDVTVTDPVTGVSTTTKQEVKGGRYQVDPTTGLYKLTGVTTNVVGNREPKLNVGLTNNFRYKALSVSILLDFRFGGDVYNGTQYSLISSGQSKQTLNRSQVTVEGVDSKTGDPVSYTYKAGETYVINKVSYSGENMIEKYYSSYASNAYNLIQSVNWVKLRSVNISYDFTNLLASRQKFIKGLTASISGSNLCYWTNYKGGMDPEVAAVGSGAGGSGSVGIDYCGVPSQRTFSFGVNITF
jgi:ferric enterobactin receptor